MNTIYNDEFEIIRITKSHYKEIEQLFINNFLKCENFCIAVDMCSNEQSLNEMLFMLNEVLDNGVSFAARHIQSNELVAMCANKFVFRSTGYLEENTFTSPAMICVCEWLTRMENEYDIFKEWEIDCALEIMFLATHVNFGKRGLALALSKHSIEFARKLLNGTLNDKEICELPPHLQKCKPKAINSIFTSNFTQKLGQKLNFKELHSVSYKNIYFQGTAFAEKINPIHEYCTYAAFKL